MTHLFETISSEPIQSHEKLVLIPPNYEQKRVVPICIRTIDDLGRPVYSGWIDAVRPVSNSLRRLAQRVLRDVYKVSELAEGSVHSLSARYGEELRDAPSRRILADAKWRALDLAAGGRRSRVGRDIDLWDETLVAMKDPHDFTKEYEDREFFERLQERLKSAGQIEALIILEMYLSNSEDEIATLFGIPKNSQERNTLSQRFRRTLQRTLKLL